MSAALPLLLALGFQPVLACVYAKRHARVVEPDRGLRPTLGVDRFRMHSEPCQTDTL